MSDEEEREDLMRYDLLTQAALRQVVRLALLRVARDGLPGEHHFFISFLTTAPGVSLSKRLLERYPEEMTIVIQHQFWNLKVYDDRFDIELSFNDVVETLSIPYEAIKGFFDPSVQFGLQFVSITDDERQLLDGPAGDSDPAGGDDHAATAGSDQDEAAGDDADSNEDDGAKVVSLDTFRKK